MEFIPLLIEPYIEPKHNSILFNVGPTGSTGPTGAIGPRGPIGKGEKGDIGERGMKGPKGDIGPKGDTGPKGDIGPRGFNGDLSHNLFSCQLIPEVKQLSPIPKLDFIKLNVNNKLLCLHKGYLWLSYEFNFRPTNDNHVSFHVGNLSLSSSINPSTLLTYVITSQCNYSGFIIVPCVEGEIFNLIYQAKHDESLPVFHPILGKLTAIKI